MKEVKIPQKKFGRDKDLKSWNMVQYNLWLEFTKTSEISTEDYKKLIIFGTFFDSYVSSNHKLPNIVEITNFFTKNITTN